MKAQAIEKQMDSYKKERKEKNDYIKKRKMKQREVRAKKEGIKRR
jgi:hypothetical protein